MQKEYKQIDFFVDTLDAETRIIKGFAATWDIDSVGDRIDKDAFNDTIVNNFLSPIERKGSPDIRFCREHEHKDVIGKILDLQVTSKGLYLEAYISKTQLGEDTYTLLKDRALDRLSIGFTVESKKDLSYEGNIRVIKKLRLYEISVVTFPANENAEVFSVKSADGKLMNRFEEFFSSLSEMDQDTILGSMRSFLTVNTEEVKSDEPPVEEVKAEVSVPLEPEVVVGDEGAEQPGEDPCDQVTCPNCGTMIDLSCSPTLEMKDHAPELEDEMQKLEEYLSTESNCFEVTKSLNQLNILLEGYLKNNVR